MKIGVDGTFIFQLINYIVLVVIIAILIILFRRILTLLKLKIDSSKEEKK